MTADEDRPSPPPRRVRGRGRLLRNHREALSPRYNIHSPGKRIRSNRKIWSYPLRGLYANRLTLFLVRRTSHFGVCIPG